MFSRLKIFHFSPRKNTGPKIAWGETYERGTHVPSNYSKAVLGKSPLT
jgi:hypothetical protein